MTEKNLDQDVKPQTKQTNKIILFIFAFSDAVLTNIHTCIFSRIFLLKIVIFAALRAGFRF